jgi:hypothetical protein
MWLTIVSIPFVFFIGRIHGPKPAPARPAEVPPAPAH